MGIQAKDEEAKGVVSLALHLKVQVKLFFFCAFVFCVPPTTEII